MNPLPLSGATFDLDQEGRYWHEGRQVEHPGVDRMLRRHLQRLEDGRYAVVWGPRRSPVRVADAPFQVLDLCEQAGKLELQLSNEAREQLSPSHLSYRGDVPYAILANGDRARFSHRAALTLAHYIDEEDGALVIRLAGTTTKLRLEGDAPESEG